VKKKTEDKAAVAAGATALGCIGFLVILKLAVIVAVIWGLVEIAQYLSSLH
jgi:hypothetical protein